MQLNTTELLFRSEIAIGIAFNLEFYGCKQHYTRPYRTVFFLNTSDNRSKNLLNKRTATITSSSTSSANADRPYILLTNDDGADSPLFALLIETMTEYADLSIAVPAREQSWQGKSMTRHGDVVVESVEIAGHQAYTIDGTPADCVNIALYNLLDRKPDLVVSGINVGLNAGLSLVWASGTVGACLEGNIAGIPGLALSQQLDPATYGYWDTHRSFEPDLLSRLRAATALVMPEIWDTTVLKSSGNAVTYNVNLPFELSKPTLERSYLGHSWYQNCFVGSADKGFKHRLQPFERDSHPQADNNVLARGHVSVSTLDMQTFGRL